MDDQNQKSLDILGIQPLTESLRIITEGVIEGVGAFLSRI
jgi:hypothetical protein